VSDYASKISALRERLGAVSKQLVSLADKRRSYSLAATEGNAEAAKQISDLDFASDALRREEATVGSAIEIAEALSRQEQQDIEARARHERQVAAYKVSRAVITLNEEVDMRLVQLREAFERRAGLLVELADTEVVDRTVVMKLAGRTGPTAASHSAGLGRFINLDMMPVVSHRPLADSNELLLGIGEAPDAKTDKPRVPRTNTRH
jgi:hypothetical protein